MLKTVAHGMMNAPLSPLTAVSPLDGRYRDLTAPLADYFSEAAFFRYRVRVEIEYLIALADFWPDGPPPLTETQRRTLRGWYEGFDIAEARRIKAIEARTRHDVKAVEYWIREKLEAEGMAEWIPWVHFGLTSQDVNHPALTLMLKEAADDVLYPAVMAIRTALGERARAWSRHVMIGRTHGQPATPTTLGKEVAVFAYRIDQVMEQMRRIPFSTKFGGTVGNLNAHYAVAPDKNWEAFAHQFIQSLGLQRQCLTTQIENYDLLALRLRALATLNGVLLDFVRDVWLYISIGYFGQQAAEQEVGSSTMPHKVNPIDFENAEGNLGMANAMAHHLAEKLPISRWQRDLSDSTVVRNLGVPLAYSLIAYRSIERGLQKISPRLEKMRDDLRKHPEVLAEAVQTHLRALGYADAYEILKAATRGRDIDPDQWRDVIERLPVNETVKARFRTLSPEDYVGIAVRLAEKGLASPPNNAVES